MKVIKLNRRFKMYKEHGHQAGLRFDTWNQQAQAAEAALRQITQTGGWSRDNEWYSWVGQPTRQFGTRPYFITVRDEQILSLVLLSLT